VSRAHWVAFLSVLVGMLWAPSLHARVLLSADGPGNTYPLIQQFYNPETPDCGHKVEHITEEFDDELQKNVFVFALHVSLDDDRCGATDRQRTEIRAKVADISATSGQTVYYRWKFKLPVGFQSTDAFTHIFQIKSDNADPIMTLTPRATTLEIGGRIGTHGATSKSKFVGVWVVVDLKVLFSNSGNVAMTIRRLSTGETLFSYSGNADMWDDGAGNHDSKFGIYRSLDNRSQLRDEQVRFADFCTSKVSASECDDGLLPPSDAGVADVNVVDAGNAPDARIDVTSGAGAGGAAGGGGAATTTTTTTSSGGATGSGGDTGAGGLGSTTTSGTGGAGGAGGTGGATPHQSGSGGSRADNGLQGGCACHFGSRGTTSGAMAFVAMAACALARSRRRRRH
jgi:hypothetical protein